MKNKVEVKNLYKDFNHFTLGNLSFSIPCGYITGFIGKNGMGKTTTIKCLLSLIKHRGEICVDGKDIRHVDYLQDVGVIMDDSFLAKDWSLKLVNKAMKTGYRNWNEDLFFYHLNRFNLPIEVKVKELSRGMKIKLMLAIALSHKAKLLILDEPTSGLDPGMRDELTDMLQEYMEDENHTVLFSTHITSDLERIADYIIFINEGKIVAELSKEDFEEKFLIIKGGLDDFKMFDSKTILGYKKSAHSFEALVERESFLDQNSSFVIEVPDIEKVLVLYGRNA